MPLARHPQVESFCPMNLSLAPAFRWRSYNVLTLMGEVVYAAIILGLNVDKKVRFRPKIIAF